jgi:hypothetical protein
MMAIYYTCPGFAMTHIITLLTMRRPVVRKASAMDSPEGRCFTARGFNRDVNAVNSDVHHHEVDLEERYLFT